MMTRRRALQSVAFVIPATFAFAADRYTGPVPPKKDVPYLLHADNLVETEVVTASQTSKKDEDIFSVDGVTSPARTPLGEPIFLFAADQVDASSLGLYQFDISGGRRQINIKKKGQGLKSFHTSVRTLAPGLFRIEASEYLQNGEYCLSPQGQNIAFCFTVF